MRALIYREQFGLVVRKLLQRLLRERRDFLQPILEILVLQDDRKVIAVSKEPATPELPAMLRRKPVHEGAVETVLVIGVHAPSHENAVVTKAPAMVAAQFAQDLRVAVELAVKHLVFEYLERHTVQRKRHHETVSVDVLHMPCDRMPEPRHPVFDGADRAEDLARDGWSATHYGS
ncbi:MULTISPECIES: hypothetical protein [Paraburkholderia]|uniref:Uncharacterized protein n=1 Tax=Paraburkholderia caribensis TaxID=75105 RepID=A0ABV0E8R8_9BURK|nr:MULTISPECIES: hypothetical protein [Paraburkholderia]